MYALMNGIRILDITSVVLGPYGSSLLGSLGAEIIKIEPPEGEIFRFAQPMRNSKMGAGFLNINRNKKSLALDLKSSEGQEILGKLIASADILFHNMRRQAAKSLKLDPESVQGLNPNIIHCAATGFGEGGHYRDDPAYDDIIQGLSSFTALNADADGAPRFAPTIIADKVTGMYAAQSMLAALLHRERSGEALAIETPMFETMASFMLAEHMGGEIFDPAIAPPGYSRMLTPLRRPHATTDGYICVLPYSTAHWRKLFELAGRDDLLNESWWLDAAERSKQVEQLYQILSDAMQCKTSSEWLKLLNEAQIPSGPIHTLDSLLTDTHLHEAGFFTRSEHPTEGAIRTIRSALHISGQDEKSDAPAPNLGEHNRNILTELGYDNKTISQFYQDGILGDSGKSE